MAKIKGTEPKVNNQGRYENPWKAWPFGYTTGAIKFMKSVHSLATRSSDRSGLEKNLPVYKPYFMNKNDDIDDRVDMIRATWLGHASVLVEIDGFTILCDPVFGDRCPPMVGPKRYRNPPCEVHDLPRIDAVLISHNHYDHMDRYTIEKLSALHKDVTWLIPMNDTSNLTRMLHKNQEGKIREMTWWQNYELLRIDKYNKERMIKIYFTPTQHCSNRGVFDSFKSLWGSWALIGSTHRFWFGGDTGYCGAFKEIGDQFGPFHGAAIPIGAYAPRDLTKFQHVDPDEAVMIHKDIKSAHSFGIYWGTFQLTEEHYFEPKEKLDAIVAKDSGVSFITINHGETMEIIGDKYRIIHGEEQGLQSENKRKGNFVTK